MDRRINTLELTMETGFAAVNARLDRMDLRLDRMDARFDAQSRDINARFDAQSRDINLRFDAFQREMAKQFGAFQWRIIAFVVGGAASTILTVVVHH